MDLNPATKVIGNKYLNLLAVYGGLCGREQPLLKLLYLSQGQVRFKELVKLHLEEI